jgi:geranylgeranyl diphosphate synthase type I
MTNQINNKISLQEYTRVMLPAIEEEMQQCVAITREKSLEELYFMLAYHLGWEGPGAGQKACGKRVRPLLVLLTSEAAGGEWRKALPAAAAVELVHNFSLIHDDIQDNSPLRRGRQTVWKKWDIPLAINAGDSMFSLAHIALERLQGVIAPELVSKAQSILPMACLRLTQGQYLDLSYEHRTDLSMQDYWPMISGKTASLIATCAELGSLIAGADENVTSSYREFGQYVGLAFQVQDDILGIWGDSGVTGKSVVSDLVEGKISLPVFYALENSQSFRERWHQGPIAPEEVPEIVELLSRAGAFDYAKTEAERLTHHALTLLEQAHPAPHAASALCELADQLTKRQS